MTIAILMSTYNGDKFITKQLESIISQTIFDWKLYIHDDGSNDNTVSIIEKYVKKDERINFLEGAGGLGPSKAFLSLIAKVESEYYVLCDQDDIWRSNKLEILQQEIINCIFDGPILIYSSVTTISDNDHHISDRMEKKIGRIKKPLDRFLWNDAPGCTMIFNKELKMKLKNNDDQQIIMHDWWLVIIAETFGKVKFIHQPLISYRLHSGNSVGTSGNIINRMSGGKLIQRINSRINKQMNQVELFLKLFSKDIMPQNTDRFLNELLYLRTMSLFVRIKFLYVYKPQRGNLLDTVSFFLWVLLAK